AEEAPLMRSGPDQPRSHPVVVREDLVDRSRHIGERGAHHNVQILQRLDPAVPDGRQIDVFRQELVHLVEVARTRGFLDEPAEEIDVVGCAHPKSSSRDPRHPSGYPALKCERSLTRGMRSPLMGSISRIGRWVRVPSTWCAPSTGWATSMYSSTPSRPRW